MDNIINQRIESNMKQGNLTSDRDFAFSQHMQKQGIQPQHFNHLFELLEKRLSQNEESVNNEQAEKLKAQWKKYLNLQKELPEIVDTKEENYYLFTEKVGLNPPGTYHNILKTRYTEQAANNRNDEMIEINDFRRKITVMLNDYTGLTNSSSKIKDLLKLRREQKEILEDKIDDFIGTVNTNERKIFYESKEEEWLTFYKNALFFIYYLLIVYYILIGPFFSNGHYKNYKVWVILLLCIALPFFLMNIIRFFYNLYEYMKDVYNRRIPRNVYIDL